jgi:hypothetical protein
MKLFRRTFVTVCCLGLSGMVVVWPHTHRTGDGIIVNRERGRAVGIATNPGAIFFTNNQAQNDSPASLHSRTWLKHYQYLPRDPGDIERYLIVTHFALMGDRGGSSRVRRSAPRYPTVATRWAVPGLRAQGGTFNGIDYEQIVVSFWLITCALAVAPAITAARLIARVTRRRRRLTRGQCLDCGFDLRASTDRCPECGHPIPATTAAAGVKPTAPPAQRLAAHPPSAEK